MQISGVAMGTFYNVTIAEPPDGIDVAALKQDIDHLLDDIEQDLSTYRPDSALSRFNARTTTDWLAVTPRLCSAIEQALVIAADTDGAFDPTVGPLVNLWGFGPGESRQTPPNDDEVSVVRESVGYGQVETRCSDHTARKKVGGVYIDLSGFAKGLGVDEVVALLDRKGLDDFLVEIGGDLFARGTRSNGAPWRIAIERPLDDQRMVEQIVELSDAAIATSGDYRNYFVHDGRRFAHVIDPRSGYPATHETASVTVYADSTAVADALATALLVMGEGSGMTAAESRQLGAYFMSRKNGSFEAVGTTAFPSPGLGKPGK